MERLDWTNLRYFLAFVRGGSMRAAAAALGVGHATVARRLEQLERSAGGALYGRDGDGMRLSEFGEELRATAERVEAEIEGLARRRVGKDAVLKGVLTLTTLDALAVEPFIQVLLEFRQAHPEIDLRLDTSVSYVDLDRREADLALRFGEAPGDNLIGRRLTKTARAVYGAQTYLDAHGPDLAASQAGWISFSPAGVPEPWKGSLSALPTRLRCADMRTQVIACRAGVRSGDAALFSLRPGPGVAARQPAGVHTPPGSVDPASCGYA